MKGFVLFLGVMLIFFGIWKLGRFFHYKIAYEDMVKETCRIEVQKYLEANK